ncbi:MAG: hypothetical protein A3C36_01110 [Omnitrophica WOR_2 bacterium RIFCSPHIGHO2_02_FULL_52_10]|nr:MAG: hypothetical protein A3C36_01110 [Omnitrophica WOR_2 bacterium RIFCSPHIGHO2_02_FULL_52_10]
MQCNLMGKAYGLLCHQFVQVKDGGAGVFFHKLKKLMNSLLLYVAAPLAVRFDWNWQAAYISIGNKNMRYLKKLCGQKNSQTKSIQAVADKTIRCFKKVIERNPDLNSIQEWAHASRALQSLYFLQGNMLQLDEIVQLDADVRGRLIKRHQLDSLNMEFIPLNLALGSIGVYEHLESHIKAGILGISQQKKVILLLNPQIRANNPHYLKYWHKYITVITDPALIQILSPFAAQLTIPLASYMVLNKKISKSFLTLGTVREQWNSEGRLPLLTISDEDYELGWECLKSFGIGRGDWFVCLHVRESGWRGDNTAVEDFRNADIDTYQSAIEEITKAGGWVVRMGNTGMKPLPKAPRVIDYANCSLKSDAMDIFLCAQCRFFIGTSSGLYTLAMAFGVPVVMTNLLPACAMYYLTSKDLFIPRLCKLKGSQGYLDFKELLSPPIGTAITQSIYDARNIGVIANEADDIKAVVSEMLERSSGNITYGQEDERLQKVLRDMTLDCGHQYGEENIIINARMGRHFLRKHAGLLSFKEKHELNGVSR